MTSNPIRKADDEIVVVRHFHLGQGLRVHHLILRDQIVGGEQVGAERVDLVVGERVRRRPRHGAADIVEQRRRPGPEIGDGLERRDAIAGERRIADHDVARAAFAVVAVTEVAALVDIELGALRGGAASGRQIAAVRHHADVPRLDVGFGDRLAQSRRIAGTCRQK